MGHERLSFENLVDMILYLKIGTTDTFHSSWWCVTLRWNLLVLVEIKGHRVTRGQTLKILCTIQYLKIGCIYLTYGMWIVLFLMELKSHIVVTRGLTLIKNLVNTVYLKVGIIDSFYTWYEVMSPHILWMYHIDRKDLIVSYGSQSSSGVTTCKPWKAGKHSISR